MTKVTVRQFSLIDLCGVKVQRYKAQTMKKNIRSIDRIIRFLLAAAVAILYFTNIISGTLAMVSGIIAIILAATAITGFCPVYYALGITTRKKSSQQ